MQSNHLILCRPLLLLPSIFPSIGVFSNESALCIRWPKDCSFSFSPSNEYSGLIFFRIDWLDLLAVRGTLKSLGAETPGSELRSTCQQREEGFPTTCCTPSQLRLLNLGTVSVPLFMSSVQFSRSVVSDSLRPHELQHARPPCPSPTPGVHPNSCLLSR